MVFGNHSFVRTQFPFCVRKTSNIVGFTDLVVDTDFVCPDSRQLKTAILLPRGRARTWR